jgi:hypothetical protein
MLYWTAIRDWMSIWRRFTKAWQVIWYGAAVMDDFYICEVDKARDLAKMLNEWADTAEQKLVDEVCEYSWDKLQRLHENGFDSKRLLQYWVGRNFRKIQAGEFDQQIKKHPWFAVAVEEYKHTYEWATAFTNYMREQDTKRMEVK